MGECQMERTEIFEDKNAKGSWQQRLSAWPEITSKFASTWCLEGDSRFRLPVVSAGKFKSIHKKFEGQ